MDNKELIALLAVAVTGTSFAFGLVQYARAQSWKRAEFVAAQIKEFEAQVGVRNALKMLDWHDGELEALTDGEDAQEFSNTLVIEALKPETEKAEYTDPEAAIVDSFTQFFDGIERFSHFVETQLVQAEDLLPYLRFAVVTIADQERSMKPPEFCKAVCRYAVFYKYSGVVALFRRYGRDIESIAKG